MTKDPIVLFRKVAMRPDRNCGTCEGSGYTWDGVRYYTCHVCPSHYYEGTLVGYAEDPAR